MTDAIGQSCGSCRFWRSQQAQNGCCVLNPPVSLVVGMQQVQMPPSLDMVATSREARMQTVNQPVFSSFFPAIQAEGWCGQWSVRDFAGDRPAMSKEDILDLKSLEISTVERSL